MEDLVEQLENRRQLLTAVNHEEAGQRLLGLLSWMGSVPEILEILKKIRREGIASAAVGCDA